MEELIKRLAAFGETKSGKRIMSYILGDELPYTISDEDCKDIIAMQSKQENLEPDEIALLSLAAGDYEPTTDGYEQGAEDVTNGYAKHLYNYLYTYKNEAAGIDPSIDPNEEHIGIMAQDLEKVNPACIKELPNGVKTVDTNRLALMNAGAIADLARRLDAIGG